jgi:hypothetical protein
VTPKGKVKLSSKKGAKATPLTATPKVAPLTAAPKTAPIGFKPTAKPGPAPRLSPVEAAKARLRQKATTSRTNSELNAAFEDAIIVAEGGTPASRVAARATADRAAQATNTRAHEVLRSEPIKAKTGFTKGAPKAAPAATKPAPAPKAVSTTPPPTAKSPASGTGSQGRGPRVTPQDAGAAPATKAQSVVGRTAAFALKATGLKPFPKKLALVAGATVAYSQRDKLAGFKGVSLPDMPKPENQDDSEDEAFLNSLPEEQRTNIKALMEVRDKEGQAGLDALVAGLKSAERDAEYQNVVDLNNATLSDTYTDVSKESAYKNRTPQERENETLKRMKSKRDSLLRKHVKSAFDQIKTDEENERLRRS